MNTEQTGRRLYHTLVSCTLSTKNAIMASNDRVYLTVCLSVCLQTRTFGQIWVEICMYFNQSKQSGRIRFRHPDYIIQYDLSCVRGIDIGLKLVKMTLENRMHSVSMDDTLPASTIGVIVLIAINHYEHVPPPSTIIRVFTHSSSSFSSFILFIFIIPKARFSHVLGMLVMQFSHAQSMVDISTAVVFCRRSN